MKTCGVYAIENILNGHRYYGSSLNVRKRWATHRSRLRAGTHDNPHLQSAWNLYGEGRFQFIIIQTCVPEEVTSLEDKYLKCSDAHYNLLACATTPTFSRESRQRMSAAKKGKAPSSSALEALRTYWKGRKQSPEHVQKRADKLRGAKYSPERVARMKGVDTCSTEARARVNAALQTPEVKEKIARAHRGKTLSAETRSKISAAKRGCPGVPCSEEKKAMLRARMLGVPKSPESVARMSASKKGRPAHNKGKPMSPEQRARMREARLRYLQQQSQS